LVEIYHSFLGGRGGNAASVIRGASYPAQSYIMLSQFCLPQSLQAHLNNTWNKSRPLPSLHPPILYSLIKITFYILLTVHHVMILGKWSTWCTNSFLCVCFYL